MAPGNRGLETLIAMKAKIVSASELTTKDLRADYYLSPRPHIKQPLQLSEADLTKVRRIPEGVTCRGESDSRIPQVDEDPDLRDVSLVISEIIHYES